jgi:hypothetical protein
VNVGMNTSVPLNGEYNFLTSLVNLTFQEIFCCMEFVHYF